MTGSLLMPTLLRMRAAKHMAHMAKLLNNEDDKIYFSREAKKSIPHIGKEFSHKSGWLKASTGISSQPDVFGTLYALYSESLEPENYKTALKAVLESLTGGQIEQKGALRHVPTNYNFNDKTMWEKTKTKNNDYQNGGYWFMPAGWMVTVLHREGTGRAEEFLRRYLETIKAEDFRKRQDGKFSPWEWIFSNERSVECPVFGPSVTLPYAILSGMEKNT
jgi:hypothetical protein